MKGKEQKEPELECVYTDGEGWSIWRGENKLIGGYDYYSDAIAGGYKVVDAVVCRQELEAIVWLMRREEKKARDAELAKEAG